MLNMLGAIELLLLPIYRCWLGSARTIFIPVFSGPGPIDLNIVFLIGNKLANNTIVAISQQ